MVEIFSKQSGPRREDVAAKRLIDQNRTTIERLANHLSGGDYKARLKPPAAPQPSGFILHDMSGGARAVPASPYVRISQNDRVVLVDGETSKQMHFLGEVRYSGPVERRFVLATEENKFHFPLDEDLCRKLAEIDLKSITDTYSEEDLAAEIGERLGLD